MLPKNTFNCNCSWKYSCATPTLYFILSYFILFYCKLLLCCGHKMIKHPKKRKLFWQLKQHVMSWQNGGCFVSLSFFKLFWGCGKWQSWSSVDISFLTHKTPSFLWILNTEVVIKTAFPKCQSKISSTLLILAVKTCWTRIDRYSTCTETNHTKPNKHTRMHARTYKQAKIHTFTHTYEYTLTHIYTPISTKTQTQTFTDKHTEISVACAGEWSMGRVWSANLLGTKSILAQTL